MDAALQIQLLERKDAAPFDRATFTLTLGPAGVFPRMDGVAGAGEWNALLDLARGFRPAATL